MTFWKCSIDNTCYGGGVLGGVYTRTSGDSCCTSSDSAFTSFDSNCISGGRVSKVREMLEAKVDFCS
jgi:hypothetical protein